jgi:NAD+ synthase
LQPKELTRVIGKMFEAEKLDLDKTTQDITEFIKEIVNRSKADGVVVGLSGGVDSSLVVTLCVRAIDKARILGVLMPTTFTPDDDVKDAKDLADWLGIRTELINIQPISEMFFKNLQIDRNNHKHRIPMANIYARIRMIILYYYANLNNYLVAGTGDRSEDLIGYFTKYGDGGVDFLPISHLYKTQVRQLAKHLGIPEKIANKPSSPQLYPGHQATDEIPTSYENLDPVLIGLFDNNFPPEKVSQLTGVSVETISEILHRFNKSKHKRTYPWMLKEW